MKKIKIKTALSYIIFYFCLRFGEILVKRFSNEEKSREINSYYWNFEDATKGWFLEC